MASLDLDALAEGRAYLATAMAGGLEPLDAFASAVCHYLQVAARRAAPPVAPARVEADIDPAFVAAWRESQGQPADALPRARPQGADRDSAEVDDPDPTPVDDDIPRVLEDALPPDTAAMDAARFQNALRIMWNLDKHVLVKAGLLDPDDAVAWDRFRDHPHETAIRLSHDRMARYFALIEARQPKREDR